MHLQQAGNCRGIGSATCLSDSRPTSFAGQIAIELHAGLSGTRATRGEIDGDLVAKAEVHLIWRLASEGGMGNNGIVFLDIERDQPFQRRECVELVQKQPAMLERTPQGLDHGIGIADLDLGEDAAQLPETKKAVDLIIDILDARVGYHGGAIAILGKILRCLDENLTGDLWFEVQNQLPGQDSPTEIVDHRVQIRARGIEQFDDRDVDVPKFVWLGRPNTFLGFGRIDAMTWPKPSAFANEASPCRRREEDLADPLSMQRQRKDAHVAVVLRDYHVSHVGSLWQ